MINWHLNYEGPKCIEMQDRKARTSKLMLWFLAEGHAGLNLNHNIVVLDLVESQESRDDGGQFPIFSY